MNTRSKKASRTGMWLMMLTAAWLAHTCLAEAYIGPGAGISVIGTAVAFVGSVLFAIVGFVWYPLKRLWMAIRRVGARGSQYDEYQDAAEL